MRIVVVNPTFDEEIGMLDDVAESLSGPDPLGFKESVKPAVWQAYGGIEVAAGAVKAMESAETLEEFVKAEVLARKALEELAKAATMARGAEAAAEMQATRLTEAAEGIGDPGLKDIVKGALSKVKSGASTVLAAAKKAGAKVVEVAKKVAPKVTALARKAAPVVKKVGLGAAKAALSFMGGPVGLAVTGGAALATYLLSRGKGKGEEKAPPKEEAAPPKEEAAPPKEEGAPRGGEVPPSGEEAPREEGAPARKPGLIARIGKWFSDRWNDVNKKWSEAFANLMGAQSAKAAATASMQRLRAIAPQVRDAAWLANYRALEARYEAEEAKYQNAVHSYNRDVQTTKDIQEKEKKTGGPVEGISDIGDPLGPLAIVGIAAAAAALLASIAMAYRKISGDADALVKDADARRLTAESTLEAIKTEEQKTSIVLQEMERIQAEIVKVNELYEKAVQAGDDEAAKKFYDQLAALKAQQKALLDRASAPLSTMLPVVPTTEKPSEKPSEKREPSWLERTVGITGSQIATVGGVVLLVWVLSKMAPPAISAIRKATEA